MPSSIHALTLELEELAMQAEASPCVESYAALDAALDVLQHICNEDESVAIDYCDLLDYAWSVSNHQLVS